MALEIQPPLPPMEARSVEQIPATVGWQYEPKWDGFRCLAFRRGNLVYLQSKSGQPLARYFPDVVEAIRALPARNFVVDGELAIPFTAYSPSMSCNCDCTRRPAECRNWPKHIPQFLSSSICLA